MKLLFTSIFLLFLFSFSLFIYYYFPPSLESPQTILAMMAIVFTEPPIQDEAKRQRLIFFLIFFFQFFIQFFYF